MKTIICQVLIHPGGSGYEAGENPAVFQKLHLPRMDSLAQSVSTAKPFSVHEHQAGRIPDLVGKGTIALGAALRKSNVGAGRGHGRQREAHSIRAVALRDLDRVNHVALGL